MIAASSGVRRASDMGLFLLLMIITLTCPIGVAANAESLQVHGIVQHDLDGDGQPDLTVISCSFATDQDSVYVYDGATDMTWGADWTGTTDFDNDIWVFDVESDGYAQLIIVFTTNGALATAHIYDDRNGDGYVAYKESGSKIEVTESAYWTVQVISTSDQGWRLPDGRLSSTMEISMDGAIEVDSESAASGLTNWLQSVLLNDGIRDKLIEVVDTDQDGVAEYVLERVVTPTVPGGVFSARLYVNSGHRQWREYDDHVFWPFLVGTHRYEGYRYFDHPPAISVNWSESKVDRAGLMGYPIEEGYHINSFAPWAKGTINYANFENPMAYYDLAEDSDGDPELFVRLETYAPYDERIATGNFPHPLVEADYAWDQDNYNMTFDYQLSLIARHPIESAVWFPDFAVRVVPHADAPRWVTERAWDVAVFTVAEDGGRRGSEGMYSWTVSLGMKDGTRVESGIKSLYATGLVDDAPTWAYSEIDQGRRGEISYSFLSQPYLYFSPVDRKLHLPGIDYGLWNIDGGSQIEYADLQADGFIDEWRLSTGDELHGLLLAPSGFLVYAGNDRLQLKQVEVPSMLFSTSPPRDHQEWMELDRQLSIYGGDFAPWDFRAMIDQFDGPSTEIEGVSIRDWRYIGHWFRFVLDAPPGFRVVSDPDGWASTMTAPGAYAISFDGTAWDVRPATPAAVRSGELLVGEPGQPLQALEWTSIKIRVENDGLEDVLELPVYAVLTGPGGEQEVLTTTVSLLPAEGSQQVAWDWAPPAAGAWQARIEAGFDPGSAGGLPSEVLVTADLYVQPQSLPSPEWLLSLGTPSPPAILALLGGIALLASAAVALWAAGRGLGSQP